MRIDGCSLGLVYGKEEKTVCLRDVSISLKPGEMNIIQGPSGSGKSSLIYLLSGLRIPTTGTVFINDKDFESFTPNEKDILRRQKFGFVFQRLFLLNYLTAMENVMVGLQQYSSSSRQYALTLLRKLGIGHLAEKKPPQLSQGQRQRIAVARALANTPEVIFADEPTASLDHENALDVMRILNECKTHAAILAVTHDLSILEKADKIFTLRDGIISKS
ncbi:MAG: ABC transporter ATP-binding protein [Ruminiclostridium sp.]|nr:ABC transporter ATP-binding protein [Ruminiclostridium sp.]